MESNVEHLVFAVASISKEIEVDMVADWIERATGIKFERRQGDYTGGNYCQASGPRSEELRVQNNYISFTDDWMEDNFREYPLLVYIRSTQRAEWFERLMRGFDLGRCVRVR
jgi:hypothetical protein